MCKRRYCISLSPGAWADLGSLATTGGYKSRSGAIQALISERFNRSEKIKPKEASGDDGFVICRLKASIFRKLKEAAAKQGHSEISDVIQIQEVDD